MVSPVSVGGGEGSAFHSVGKKGDDGRRQPHGNGEDPHVSPPGEQRGNRHPQGAQNPSVQMRVPHIGEFYYT